MTLIDATIIAAWLGAKDDVTFINPAVVVAIISAVVAGAGGVLSYRAATKANRTSDRKVDLEEHRDSIDRLKKIIDEQDAHQARLTQRHRAEMDLVNRQLDDVQAQMSQQQKVERLLRSQVSTLEDQVRTLRRLVGGGPTGLPLPDLPPNSD